MRTNELQEVQFQLEGFVDRFRIEMPRKDQSRQCENYLSGLLLDGERKSVEPMAARLPGVQRQALHHFVCYSPWDSEKIQNRLWRHMLDELHVRSSDTANSVLILDDTGFLKKGAESVGVGRQYFGLQGQTNNCQILVSWHYSHGRTGAHLPLRGELYLPKNWTDDPKKMKKASVPPEKFESRTKWQIALELLDQFRSEVPHEAIVFDAGYGCVKELARELRLRKESYVAAIPSSMSFWPHDVVTHLASRKHYHAMKPPASVVTSRRFKPMQGWQWYLFAKSKHTHHFRWKTVHLKDSKHTSVRATAFRVRERGTSPYTPGEECWLIIEEMGKDIRYSISNLPADTSLEKLVLLRHARWPVEQGYQQLKEELGLDHYEGRSWPGFHHHVTLCFMAYDFLTLIQYQNLLKKTIQRPADRSAPRCQKYVAT